MKAKSVKAWAIKWGKKEYQTDSGWTRQDAKNVSWGWEGTTIVRVLISEIPRKRRKKS